MQIRSVFFDLDGTLWPPHSVVLPAYQKVFEQLGLAIPSDERLLDTLGYPIEQIWQQLLPETDESTRQLANRLMAAAETDLIQSGRGRPFPGVVSTLTELTAAGCELHILSNCQADYLRLVPDSLGIGHYFASRHCAGDYPGMTKAEILAQVLPSTQLPAAMVGDRWHDIAAGKQNGVLTIGCRYGLGGAEELAEADHIINAFPELIAILGQKKS